MSTHRTPHAAPDEATKALAAISLGLDALRELALGDTAEAEDQAAVLKTLYDDTDREHCVLGALSGLLTDLGQLLHDQGAEDLAEDLDEAAGYLQDSAGLRIDTTANELAPLTCQACGTKHGDVRAMQDPFTTALFPEDAEHEVMQLCPACATARFEES